MNNKMRYVTVEEKKTYDSMAKKHNIRGYSTSTFMMCSLSCMEAEKIGHRAKAVKTAKKKKPTRK